jgi:hypothetical protein
MRKISEKYSYQIIYEKGKTMKKSLITLFVCILVSPVAFASGFAGFIELDAGSNPSDMSTSHLKQFKLNSSPGLTTDIYLRNFSKAADIEKINQANTLLIKIMNSEEFKQRVLNFTFNGKKQFHDNNGKTNQEIYDHLMTGSEVLMPGSLGIMNFDLTLYQSKNPWSKVKGYTLPDTMRIWINKKFFRKSSWTPKDVAANMAHEWVHKMGFGHDYKHNADRPFSVPYAVGYIVQDLADQFYY